MPREKKRFTNPVTTNDVRRYLKLRHRFGGFKLTFNKSTEDLFEFLEFLDNVNDLGMRSNFRPRVIRPRMNNSQNYDDVDFFKRYRMSKDIVLLILYQIDEDLEFDSNRNESVPPVQQFLITLRFYATGTHLQAIADAHGVSVPTVSRVVRNVTSAIVKLRPRYIKMPESEAEIETSNTKIDNSIPKVIDKLNIFRQFIAKELPSEN